MTSSDLSIPMALAHAVADHPDQLAIAEGATRLNYAELAHDVFAAGAALRALGVVTGDRIAIWLPNSTPWIVTALGALSLGAVLVPINTRFKAVEADYMLRRSRAKVLVTTDNFLGTDYVSAASGLDLPHLDHVVGLDVAGGPSLWSAQVEAATEAEIEAVRQIAQALPADTLAEIIFTSGTTGFPKGAMLSHGQITGAYDIYADRAGIRPGDKYLIIAPMFHSFGWKAGVIVSILRSSTILPMAVFDASTALDLVDREKVTVMGGPPTIFTSLLDAAAATGKTLTSLRSIVLGGSMISPDLIRTLRDDIGVETVLSAYGLTETTALVTMASASDSVEQIANSAGQVFPNMEMRCVDDSGATVPPGQPGEIETRGANVMLGYFEDPERTAESFTEDGWFKTGDVGIIDPAGYLSITDRKKDVFITGGFNCYPAEIEAMIMAHPGVREVAVIGIPDARMGEVGKAFVVPETPLDAAELITWCREKMANFKVPRDVEFLTSLPRNAMGKVQKFLLSKES